MGWCKELRTTCEVVQNDVEVAVPLPCLTQSLGAMPAGNVPFGRSMPDGTSNLGGWVLGGGQRVRCSSIVLAVDGSDEKEGEKGWGKERGGDGGGGTLRLAYDTAHSIGSRRRRPGAPSTSTKTGGRTPHMVHRSRPSKALSR